MTQKAFLRIIQIGGIAVFSLAVLATILFAEGYQYDPEARDIIKKGVVYFEGVPQKATLFLDFEMQEGEPKQELRVVPGKHTIELRQDDFVSWKKELTVPEDTILQFPEIRLLPVAFPSTTVAPLKNTQVFSSTYGELFVVYPHLHMGKMYRPPSPEPLFVQEILFDTAAVQTLVPRTRDRLVGLDARGVLFSYTQKNGVARFDFEDAPSFKDVASDGERVYALDEEGGIWTVASGEEPELFVNLARAATGFESISASGDHLLFMVKTQEGRLLAVVRENGEIVYQRAHVSSAFLEGGKLYYASGVDLVLYDFTKKEIVRKSTIDAPIRWMHRVGKSFHFLFVTEKGDLRYCDEDYENCTTVAAVAAPFTPDSVNASAFFFGSHGKLTLFDFGSDSFLPPFLQDLISYVWKND